MRAEFVQTRAKRALKTIPRAEPIRLQSADDYVTGYSASQEVLLDGCLAELEREGLPEFFRCHRSHLVRLDLITAVGRSATNDYWLELQGHAERLPMSRWQRAKLFRLRPDLDKAA